MSQHDHDRRRVDGATSQHTDGERGRASNSHHDRAADAAVRRMVHAAEIPEAPIANVDECGARIHAKLRASELAMQHGIHVALEAEIIGIVSAKGPEAEAHAAEIVTSRVQEFAEEKTKHIVEKLIFDDAAAAVPLLNAVVETGAALDGIHE